MSPYIIFLAASLVLFAAGAWYVRTFKYIGYGWVLKRLPDGSVAIAASLLKGPAGQAHLYRGAILASLNDQPLLFSSNEEFESQLPGMLPSPMRVGSEARLICRRDGEDFEVVLRARWCDKHIPVYESDGPIPYSSMLRSGPSYCSKTGVVHTAYVLSDEALLS